MLRQLFEWLHYDQPQLNAPIAAPSAVAQGRSNEKETGTTSAYDVPKPAQSRLLQHLQQVTVSRWPTEKLLFHGCTDSSKHTDVVRKRLDGDFKWMSEDPAYAADYAFYQGPESGRPFLFVCSLRRESIAIEDSQTALHRLTNWGAAAPWRFPLEFGPIAREALGTAEPIVFLDHFHEDTGKWGEILVSNPAETLVVLNVIQLPHDKETARRLASNSSIQ